jgi:antigen flippase
MARLPQRFAGVLWGARPVAMLFQSVGTQAAVIAINVFTGVVTARTLGPDGRGAFAAITTWPQLLAALATAGLNSAVIFRMRRAPDCRAGIAAAALFLSSAASVIAIAVGMLLMPLWMARYSDWTIAFSQLCLLGVLANSSQMMVKQAFAGVGRFGLFNLSLLLPQLLYLIACIALVCLGVMNVRNAVFALIGGGLLALLVTVVPFMNLVQPRLRAGLKELKPLASYSVRAALMDAVYAVATYADRIVLIPMLTTVDLGLYAVAFSFSRVIQVAQPAIASVVFSHMARGSEAEGRSLHDRALRILLAGLVIGCTALWVLGKPLLDLAYGASFEAANAIFRLLVIEASLGAVSQVTVQLLLSRDRPGLVSTIQVIALCISLTALLLLVPHYGARGAAIALLLAGVLRWLCLLSAVRFALGQRIPRLLLNGADIHYLIGKSR